MTVVGEAAFEARALVALRAGLVLKIAGADGTLFDVSLDASGATLLAHLSADSVDERAAPAALAHGFLSCDCGEDCGEPELRAAAPVARLALAQGGVRAWFARLKAVALCSCEKFFVTDGPAAACIDCALRATCGDAAARGACPVCLEDVTTADVTECCAQPAHGACVAKWTRSGGGCQLCRAEAPRARRPRGGRV